MIKDSPIVVETRKIRQAISEQFHHDVDRYFNYLQEKVNADGLGDKRSESEKAKQSSIAD